MTTTGTDAKGSDELRILPDDRYNRELVANVHPPDWTPPEPAPRYNLVVIGAGTAGLVTAAGAAGLGARVALVERHLMGGDCLNVGCVPSKALIRAARAAAAARRAGDLGVRIDGEPRVDFPAVMERMRRLRARISPTDSAARFRDLGVDVFLGSARFTGRDTVEVGEHKLRFRKACIATGARAAAPSIEGLEDAGYLDNESVFELTELPRRLAVIGAGPIGCELAQSFARFGSRVTLVERDARILGREDADAAAVVLRALDADGVEILFESDVERVEGTAQGKRLHVSIARTGRTVDVDEILVGVGRRPNVDGLGIEAAGVEYDERGVRVDDRLRTSNRAIFAAGDVASKFKFTHAADFLARIVIRNALFPFGRARASSLTIPWCTYTEPEIAHVGLYPHEAEERGIEIDTYEQPLSEVDRAILDGEDEGFVKIHTRKGKDTILGATIVAAHAGDLISEITVALEGGVGLGSLAEAIHPYPTQGEAIRRLGDAYNKTRLKPWIRGILEKLFAITR